MCGTVRRSVDERTLRWMWSSIDWSVWVLYQALWMYPIYAVSYVLNTVWYQDIADTGASGARVRSACGAEC